MAEIYSIGINRCVDIPRKVGRGLGSGRYIPVTVEVASLQAKSTLVPGPQGQYRLFLNSRLRKAAGVDTGQFIELFLSPDPDPVAPPLPEDLEAALGLEPGLLEAYFRQSPYRQREIVRWLNQAKRATTRTQRISRVIQMLREA